MSIGFPLVGYGLIFNLWWAVPGAVCIIAAITGWVMEPSSEPDSGEQLHDPSGDDDSPESAENALPVGSEESEDTAAVTAEAGELVGASAGGSSASAVSEAGDNTE